MITTASVFAGDLVIMIKADSIREAENIANVELSKILAWAKDNKVRFNEQKSKAVLWQDESEKNKKKLKYILIINFYFKCTA